MTTPSSRSRWCRSAGRSSDHLVAFDEKQDITAYSTGGGPYGYRWGMGVKEVDVQAKTEKRDKNINAAVKKILKNFPPKVKE